MKSIEDTLSEIDQMIASENEHLKELGYNAPPRSMIRGYLDALYELKEWILE